MTFPKSLNFLNMLKRHGKELTFKLYTTEITDTLYQTGNKTEETYKCYGFVESARAYDIHSNIYVTPKETGNEILGIINIYLTKDDSAYINPGDILYDECAMYKVIAFDKQSDEYDILEAHLYDFVYGTNGSFAEL